MMRAMAIIRRSTRLAAGLLLLVAAPAYAAGRHGGGSTVVFADFLGIGHLVGSVFGTIGHVVLGAFSWTFGLAANFILTTIGAIVKLLIPRSWAKEGVQIMQWIVAIPDYAGTITGPTGQHVYGFAGINALRDLSTWIGAGLLPLTLVYATSRAMVGNGDHVAIPLVRVLGLAALLISYPRTA
jgi:prepilin-type processing-associated H-X9-DG protein